MHLYVGTLREALRQIFVARTYAGLFMARAVRTIIPATSLGLMMSSEKNCDRLKASFGIGSSGNSVPISRAWTATNSVVAAMLFR